MAFETLLYYTAIPCSILLICIAALAIRLRAVIRDSELKARTFSDKLSEAEMQENTIKNLTALYAESVEYDKSKTEFFSNIIHELKTPISVILGAIQLIDSKKQPDASQAEYKNLSIIKLNCYRLLRLANNLLDMTRLDAGYLKLNPTNCNIVGFIEEITYSVQPFAEQKKLSLTFDSPGREIYTAVDMVKMERILLNLLSNAVKFTGQGGAITVSVTSENDTIKISVKDTGIGIPANKQKDIFQRFQQVGSGLSKAGEGSGIGLSIVKSFVGLHGGDIRIISEEQKGSEFIIELPVLHVEQEETKGSLINGRQSILEAINIEFSDMRMIAS